MRNPYSHNPEVDLRHEHREPGVAPGAQRRSVGWSAYLLILLGVLAGDRLSASPMDLRLETLEQVDAYIGKRDELIAKNPQTAQYYLERADALFLKHSFDKAVDDYSIALKIDDRLDEAYLGRGMALARAGRLKESIADLDVYIDRNPTSSFAYTKRGVRHLWLGEEDRAKSDLEKAIQLDPANAEAHDDLGVIYGQRKQYYEAAEHFLTAIELDASYQKAYHNMALISYLAGKDALALAFVGDALSLLPTSRDSLLLKSHILAAMGRQAEADEIREEAEFLPQGNWSENVPLESISQ